MPGPTPTLTKDDETSIPTEHVVRNDPNMNQYPTFTVRRKAAKRSIPWELNADGMFDRDTELVVRSLLKSDSCTKRSNTKLSESP
jgi:hypothetical protein